jgi:NADH-quinone oxidoreductase subunit K
VIRPALPYLLVAVLAGLGAYAVLARRHAILVLVGVELVLGAAGLLLVTVGQTGGGGDDLAALTAGPVLTLFVITIAAAEVVLALAVLVALHRARGHVDLHADLDPRTPDVGATS